MWKQEILNLENTIKSHKVIGSINLVTYIKVQHGQKHKLLDMQYHLITLLKARGQENTKLWRKGFNTGKSRTEGKHKL